MRVNISALALYLAIPAFCQELQHLTVTIPAGAHPVYISAREIQRSPAYPGLVHAKGQVEIRSPVCLPVGPNASQVCDGYTMLYADEATLHEDSGAIDANGNVKLIPLRHEAK